MHVTHRHKILLGLVLHHRGQQIIDASGSTEEHLTLTVLDILLDIECDGLCHTEILHILRNRHSELLGQSEEMVNGMT